MTRKQIVINKENEKNFQLSLIGKIVKSYGNNKDKVLNVEQNDTWGFIYTVQDIKTNEIRKHCTRIQVKDLVMPKLLF
jgi:hypothetical protein